MKDFLTVASIFAYFIISIFIGVNQYLDFGELSNTYLFIQSLVLVISIFCTIRFQNSQSIFGEILATLGGGFAMMIIIQAVLFFMLGDVIVSNLSTMKIIVLVIIGLIIIRLVFKNLTKRQG